MRLRVFVDASSFIVWLLGFFAASFFNAFVAHLFIGGIIGKIYQVLYFVILKCPRSVGGMGAGMIFSPSIIIIGYYFDKFRALATGIAVCGSAAGTLVMSRVFALLLDDKGWQWTMRFQAGLLLTAGVVALLFSEVEPTLVEVNSEEVLDYEPVAVERSKLYNPSIAMSQREFITRKITLFDHQPHLLIYFDRFSGC